MYLVYFMPCQDFNPSFLTIMNGIWKPDFLKSLVPFIIIKMKLSWQGDKTVKVLLTKHTLKRLLWAPGEERSQQRKNNFARFDIQAAQMQRISMKNYILGAVYPQRSTFKPGACFLLLLFSYNYDVPLSSSLQPLPHTPLYSLSDSWLLFSLIVITFFLSLYNVTLKYIFQDRPFDTHWMTNWGAPPRGRLSPVLSILQLPRVVHVGFRCRIVYFDISIGGVLVQLIFWGDILMKLYGCIF